MADYAPDPDQVKALWEGNAQAWTTLARGGHDVYRDALNTPAFLALLPPVRGLSGLDIGCGEASNTRQVARLGARMTGVDVSPTFLRHARETEASDPLGMTFAEGDAMALPFGEGSFDFATAFMSLMDVPRPEAAIGEAFRVVRPGGFFQFSILHPCFVPPYRKVLRENGQVLGVQVSDYFERVDGRIDTWIFSTVPKEERARYVPFRVPRFHRTLSEWLNSVVAAGFAIAKIGEPTASDEAVRQHPMLDDTQKAGIFLHVQAFKPRA